MELIMDFFSCQKIDQIERDKGKDVDYISSIEVFFLSVQIYLPDGFMEF